MIMKVVSPLEKYKDDGIYNDIVNYCINQEKTPHGCVVMCNLDQDDPAQDMYRLSEQWGKLKGTRIRHTVVSFSDSSEKDVDREKAFRIAERACDYYAKDYQVFAAVHEDTDNLHFHMVMNTVGIQDGKKYKGRKGDFYQFQSYMKDIARKNGLKFRVVPSSNSIEE